MNLVIINGRIGNVPECKFLPSGQAVTELRVATSEQWIDKNTGQKQEETEWHRCVIWGKQGEAAAKYLEKGQSVMITGRLRTRSWETQNRDAAGNPIKAYSTEIVVSKCEWGAKSQRQEGAQAPAPPQGYAQAPQPGYAAPAPAAQGYGGYQASAQGYSNAPQSGLALPPAGVPAYGAPPPDFANGGSLSEDIPF